MKNLLSIISFAFVLLISVQSVSAQSLSQDKNKPEVIAKTQLANLTLQLDLSKDQSRTLYRAFVTKEVGYKKCVIGKNAENAEVIENKKILDKAFMASMKKTLTEKQFAAWKQTLKE